jgi:hypothetical protein
MEERVKISQKKQKEILQRASKKHGSLKELARKLKINYSSLKNYSCGNLLLPRSLFYKILEIGEIDGVGFNVSYLSPTWGKKKGGKKGMESLNKNYPKKISEWRKKGLKKGHFSNKKKIKRPKLNEKLSEFIGIYLGDGTLTKYFIRISGDYRYDRPYFNYISKLVKDLFGINSFFRKEKTRNTFYLTIYSKELCSFLKNQFNISYGHKIRNKTVIPENIHKDKKLLLSCIRGLIDTDGSISRRGRKGSQFCIDFSSHNKKLLEQVYDFGKNEEIFTYKKDTNTGTNKWENILRYFKMVGSSNLRHIVRFNERLKGNSIYQKEVSKYYLNKFYKTISIPFKMELGV